MWQPEVDPAIESSATVRANMESSASLDAPKRGESATNMERKKVVTNSIAYLMRKAIGGNQVAIKWQSSGNQVAIKWQSIAIRARRQRRTRSRTQGAPSAACAC
jgi:hypothetical protein